jgi:hypothetical protein
MYINVTHKRVQYLFRCFHAMWMHLFVVYIYYDYTTMLKLTVCGNYKHQLLGHSQTPHFVHTVYVYNILGVHAVSFLYSIKALPGWSL